MPAKSRTRSSSSGIDEPPDVLLPGACRETESMMVRTNEGIVECRACEEEEEEESVQ
jgi:hypothetical protein